MKNFGTSAKLQVKIILLTLIFGLVSCQDEYISSIPDYPVGLELNLMINYPNFRTANQALEFETPIKATDRVGYGGILVYIGFDENYYAWDMSCPYEAKTDIKVHVNDLGQTVCDECGSVYDISYGIGNPISGPSREILKRYQIQRQGDNLYIYR